MKHILSLLLLLMLAGVTGCSTAPEKVQLQSTVVDLSQDRMPKPRFRVQPVYPFAFFRAGTPGEVKIEFTVETDGRARDVRVVHATNREFAVASVEAMAGWKFEPGVKDGRLISVRMTEAFIFADGEVQILAPVPVAQDPEGK